MYLSLILTGAPLDLALPLQAYAALFEGAFGGLDAIVNTIATTTPLILGGLSVALAFKAGLFNIGAQGQIIIGAMGLGGWIGFTWHLPVGLHRLPIVLGAAIGGALWGFIPGTSRQRRAPMRSSPRSCSTTSLSRSWRGRWRTARCAGSSSNRGRPTSATPHCRSSSGATATSGSWSRSSRWRSSGGC